MSSTSLSDLPKISNTNLSTESKKEKEYIRIIYTPKKEIDFSNEKHRKTKDGEEIYFEDSENDLVYSVIYNNTKLKG